MGLRERSRARRKQIVGHVAHSHEDAEQWDLEFWQSRTPQERLSALVAIRRDMERVKARKKEKSALRPDGLNKVGKVRGNTKNGGG